MPYCLPVLRRHSLRSSGGSLEISSSTSLPFTYYTQPRQLLPCSSPPTVPPLHLSLLSPAHSGLLLPFLCTFPFHYFYHIPSLLSSTLPLPLPVHSPAFPLSSLALVPLDLTSASSSPPPIQIPSSSPFTSVMVVESQRGHGVVGNRICFMTFL